MFFFAVSLIKDTQKGLRTTEVKEPPPPHLSEPTTKQNTSFVRLHEERQKMIAEPNERTYTLYCVTPYSVVRRLRNPLLGGA